MRRRLGISTGLLLAGVAALLAVLLVGMRRGSPPVVDSVRRLNRGVLNPRQMTTAGQPGAYAAVIRHRGRVSGRAYETPIGANPTDEGFVIALPYGPRADWLKNVLADGEATIVHEGRVHPVDQPEVVPIDRVLDAFPDPDRRSLRVFGVDWGVQLRRADLDPVVG